VSGSGHSHEHSHDGPSHSHDHDDHQHGDHDHSHEAEPVPHGGPVLLDIGGDVGALVVHLDDHLAGTEIPIESVGGPSLDGKHTGVHRRGARGEPEHTVAIFDDLLEGRYTIAATPADAPVEVTIVGGQVTELDLRTT